jgi:tetrahydromethanopterin S-methyltransferase subunit G
MGARVSTYETVKKAIQDVIVPDIQEIKGELNAVNVRLDRLNKRGELNAVNVRLDRLNKRFDSLIEQLYPASSL